MYKHTKNNDPYYSTWHDDVLGDYNIKVNNTILSFSIYTMVSGCGMVILKGYNMFGSDYLDENIEGIKKDIKSILEKFKGDGVGAVITTLGEDFYGRDSERILEELFEMKSVSQYKNYRHSSAGAYSQKLYIVTL